jgi:hypothetical protein
MVQTATHKPNIHLTRQLHDDPAETGIFPAPISGNPSVGHTASYPRLPATILYEVRFYPWMLHAPCVLTFLVWSPS